jgi:HAD superfamily hydrolase (TIGR01490 family)
MTRAAAFFDLDHTLIDINSGYYWAKHEYRSGNIPLWQLGRVSFWAVMYRLSWVDIERLLDEAVRFYEGEPAEHLQRRTREWFYDEIEARLRDEASERLDAHREQGHELVLLTNSSRFEAQVAAETWEFDDWLANEFPTDDDGQLLGEFASPICYGEGKVERASDWARERDVDLEASYFYSDSYSDVPMLERAGNPRIVDPDPRLRRAAERRDWPILDW